MLPCAQVKCERDFSKLKLTKTRLRSSLCQESLQNLMIINAESGMFKNIDIDQIISELVATSNNMILFMGL